MTEIEKCRKFKREHGGDILHRALWLCGIPLPPPQFCPFVINAITNGLQVMLFFVGVNVRTLMFKSVSDMTPSLLVCVLMSSFGGAMVAWAQRDYALKIGLPAWRDYGRGLH